MNDPLNISLPDATPAQIDEAGTEVPASKLSIFSTAIQKVDCKNKSLGTPFYRTSEEDIHSYLTGLIRSVVNNTRSQSFKFSDDSCITKSLVLEIAGKNLEKPAITLSERLLNCEIIAQQKFEKITELREGSLLCAHFQLDEKQYVILVKIDHAGFLNENTLKKSAGLPEKQRAQKCATFTIIDEELDTTVIISDTNSTITEYWWKDYLQLEALSSPETNTNLAFTSLEKFLKKKIQSKSPSDYWTLRNAVVGYFQTRKTCVFSDMIDEIMGGYTPENDEINIASIAAEAKLLPTNSARPFDSHFEIVSNVIKSKIKRQINLVENVDLRITGEIKNFKETFATGEDDGRKYLKIYSDEGYAAFQKKENTDDSSGNS